MFNEQQYRETLLGLKPPSTYHYNPYTPPDQCYTTQHELAYLEVLSTKKNGKVLLENAWNWLGKRNWRGQGMSVDVLAVRHTLERLLGVTGAETIVNPNLGSTNAPRG